MKKILPAILLATFGLLIVGCEKTTDSGDGPIPAPPPAGGAVGANKPGGNQVQVGSAELQPGMSEAEAAARVGSASK